MPVSQNNFEDIIDLIIVLIAFDFLCSFLAAD